MPDALQTDASQTDAAQTAATVTPSAAAPTSKMAHDLHEVNLAQVSSRAHSHTTLKDWFNDNCSKAYRAIGVLGLFQCVVALCQFYGMYKLFYGPSQKEEEVQWTPNPLY